LVNPCISHSNTTISHPTFAVAEIKAKKISFN
jgi:hypothetical protein